MNARGWMLAVAVAAALTGSGAAREAGTTFARDALRPYVERGELPGAISVLYRDGAQETCCIGYADAAAKRPITMDDLFMQCSQTKGFCGVTVAILVEEGRLRLDDPVSKYLPEFAEMWVLAEEGSNECRTVRARTPLTVKMCLNHTAGFAFELPNHTRMGGWSRKMPLRSVAACAAANPLRFEPGSTAQYSNTGIDVAAAIVEIVAGMPWEEFVRRRVLEPLEMKDSGFWPTDERLAGRIGMYEVQEGKPARPMPFHEAMQPPFNDRRVFASAGAGLWTTARDQLRFYKMLMNLGVGENGARILGEETVKSLLAVSSRDPGLKTDDWTRDGYSLGLCAPMGDGEDRWFGHGGAWGTTCYVNWHRRELKLFVVQLVGQPRPWNEPWEAAANGFFAHGQSGGGAFESTGRMK